MKKLLVATSALVVAAPAFADVTISGTLNADASTKDLAELSSFAVTSLTVKLAATGDIGGSLEFGIDSSSVSASGPNQWIIDEDDLDGDSNDTEYVLVDADGNLLEGDDADAPTSTTSADSMNDVLRNAVTNPNISAVDALTLTGFDVYASTSLGKFNLGDSTGTMTDDDLTEMEVFGDTGAVAFASGVTGVAVNNDTAFLTYSNSFGGADVALTWGNNGSILSVGGSAAGFTFDMDSSSGEDIEGAFVINASGDVGPMNVALELDNDNDYDMKLGGSFGNFGVGLGVNSNEDSEFGVTGSAGSIDFGLYSASVITRNDDDTVKETTNTTGVHATTGIAGYSTKFAFGNTSVDETDETTSSMSATVTIMDGFTIAYGGNEGEEDITFSVDMSF